MHIVVEEIKKIKNYDDKKKSKIYTFLRLKII